MLKKLFIIISISLLFINSAHADNYKNDEEHEKNKAEYLNLEWWKNFNDEILNEHLIKLYQNNYDLKNAELKIKENEKLVKIQFSNELPELTFDGYISRDFRSSEQRFGSMMIPSFAQNNFQLPLTASYEIDIWGKNRLKTKSIEQQLAIIKQQERSLYISLTSDFASDYFNLIKTDKLIEIQDELIKLQKEILSKIEDKNKAGLCSTNEVLAEKRLLTVLNEEKNNLEEKKELLENIIKSYLAVSSGIIERKNYSSLKIPQNIPLELDTDIITNRPDFIEQEANIKRVGYDVRIARKELLPSFVIFGQIGLNAYKFSDLFKTSTQLANAGIMPTFDIFSGGRKRAFLKLKKYQYDEALNNYQKTIVEGIKEVNTALSSLKTSQKNYADANERFQIQNNMFDLTQEKEVIGCASELDVLYAKEKNLITEKDSVSDSINFVISVISLYKAAGGKNLYDINKSQDL